MKTIEQLSQKKIQRIYEIKSKISKLNDKITDLEWEINSIFIENNLLRCDFDI